jgi:hypothetical protein
MKTLQETRPAFDRMSTHEELHQVLDLLSESAHFGVAETPSEADEKEALRAAVSGLWQDTAAEAHDQQRGVLCETDPWAELLAGETELKN